MSVAAASSRVPVAEGNKVMDPTRLTAPANEVPRKLGAASWNTLLKVSSPASAKRSHSWNFAALNSDAPPLYKFWLLNHAPNTDLVPLGVVILLRSVTLPP